MVVEAEFYSENNINNQNMGMGLPYSLQPLQMPNPQDWLMGYNTGLGIGENNSVCFQEAPIQNFPITNTQQEEQFQQVHQFLGHNNNIITNNNNNNIINQAAVGLSSSSSSSTGQSFLSMELYQFLASELEKQRVEIDAYLQQQNHNLSTVLHEETRQRGVVIQKYATKLMNMVHQKDRDIAMAVKSGMELQNSLMNTEMECNYWKQKAIESEALVIDLSNKIKQVNERLSLISINGGVPDSESMCDTSSSMKDKTSYCKMCHVRSTCMLFLPCRHLCCCKSCEDVLFFCPVCDGAKEASMEIFMA